MRAAMKSRQNADTVGKDPHQELEAYLAAPLKDVADVIAWWGVSTAKQTFRDSNTYRVLFAS
jgi:hypothetical protein